MEYSSFIPVTNGGSFGFGLARHSRQSGSSQSCLILSRRRLTDAVLPCVEDFCTSTGLLSLCFVEVLEDLGLSRAVAVFFLRLSGCLGRVWAGAGAMAGASGTAGGA